jgi:hypothetical protein
VEEAAERGWEDLIARCFQEAGLLAEVRGFSLDLDATTCVDLLTAARGASRVVLLSWNARGLPGMRSLLDQACRSLADRLIVVHLRNPFDQGLVPEGVTALTPFGYRVSQLQAVADVLAGHVRAEGRLPAPVQ